MVRQGFGCQKVRFHLWLSQYEEAAGFNTGSSESDLEQIDLDLSNGCWRLLVLDS